jgi:hypothetical protein
MKQGKLLFHMDNNDGECGEEYDEDALQLGITIREKSPIGYWYIRSENVGWNKACSFAYVEQFTGKGWLRLVLPETAKRFKIFNYGKGLLVQNFHHDTCTGIEKYYCVPISEGTYYDQTYKGNA